MIHSLYLLVLGFIFIVWNLPVFLFINLILNQIHIQNSEWMKFESHLIFFVNRHWDSVTSVSYSKSQSINHWNSESDLHCYWLYAIIETKVCYLELPW